MSKILKNQTASPIFVTDTGITVDNVVDYTIPPQDYLIWAASSDIITEIGAGNIVVNDGSTDLSINDGAKLIQGIFPNPVGVASGDDLTAIGHTDDALKVSNQPSVEQKVDFTEMMDKMGDILRQLQIMTAHLQCLTDLELEDGDEGDFK